jgi:hypothetical protein
MKRLSPLRIPPERGRIFRILISSALGTFAGWALTQVCVAARTGVFDWAMKRGPLHTLRASQPELFWVYVIGFLLGFLWLFYVCCAEIVYTMLWYEPQ